MKHFVRRALLGVGVALVVFGWGVTQYPQASKFFGVCSMAIGAGLVSAMACRKRK